MNRNIFLTGLIIFAAVLMVGTVLSAPSTITGSITDAKTGEPLYGANIILSGTSMGTASDITGKYIIRNVIPGSYLLKVTYIGYKSQEIKITVKEGEHIEQNFKLEPVSIEGETVVVTAQANAQTQAINQQLASNQITNIVSADKIQSLPDANAAESVGRLPGVFVLRSGGEGYKVVIRGMSPQYNQITINGIEMGSSVPSDRSTDLSIISQYMLEGIKVFKTVTPDMDANVIGGVVNFDLREAEVKAPGVPVFNFLIQGGYNNLSVYNMYNNYKYVVSAEDRFFSNELGIFAQVDVERKNLTSNQLSTYYDHFGNSTTEYIITGLSLFNIPRDRLRYNGALNLDYKYDNGKIRLMNFFSSGTTNSQQREQTFSIGSNMFYAVLSSSSSKLSSISNVFDLSQQLSIFNLDVKLAHTYSETKNPDDWGVQFSQTSAGLSQFSYLQNANPQSVPKAAKINLAQTFLTSLYNRSTFSKSRNFTASVDLKTNLSIAQEVNAEIKFGGKLNYLNRSYIFDQYDTPQLLNSGSAKFVDNIINEHFSLPMNSTQISINNFLDPDYSYGKFLNGDYTMTAPLSYGKMSQLVNLLKNNVEYIAQNQSQGTYGHNNYQSTTHNYSGYEINNAFYVMSTLKIGPQIIFIPGIRYQTFQTSYKAVAGVTSPESYWAYNHYDTTVTRDKKYWLPDVTLRYKPFSWFDIRLSYTNTLSYPSFSAYIPRIDLSGTTLTWNNAVGLVPAHSENYDAYFSFYNNEIGLFTAGAFLKQIKNMIYPWEFYVKGAEALKYLPNNITGFNPNTTYRVYTTKNNPYLNKVYGFELEWQTHFWYLPSVLSGLVLNVNYTHTISKAKYPYVYSVSTGRTIRYIDTSFTDRLVNQPDNIFNISLGFDYEGFSIRVAMIYQAGIFTQPSQWPQLRGYTAAYRRWDISARQELPWFGIELYTNLNNINGAKDVRIIQANPPTGIEDYGFRAELGLRWKF